MDKKNNLTELKTDLTTYEKIKGKLSPAEKQQTTITGEKPSPVDTSSTTPSTAQKSYSNGVMGEADVQMPQQATTLKYLSNVKDDKTGKLSEPFMVNDKRYQMVRSVDENDNIVMGVYCHDELNETGENMVHPVEHFEKNIAQPMKEKTEMVGQDTQQMEKKVHPVAKAMMIKPKASNLSEFKHFVVNNKTGGVRKFKQIEELAKANMNEDESYMNLPQFKNYVSEKLFGSKNKALREATPTGEETDEEMSLKAKKLMSIIKSKIPHNILSTIKSPVAKREVIAAFAELIGVTRNSLGGLISQLKNISSVVAQPDAGNPEPNQSNPEQTPQQVTENRKVIKLIKIKDLNND